MRAATSDLVGETLGIQLEPDLLVRLIAGAVDPSWTIGHRFTVAVEDAEATPGKCWYLHVNDGSAPSRASKPGAERRPATALHPWETRPTSLRSVQVAIALYERFTALDAVGPYEVFNVIPGWEPVFVAERTGPVRTDLGRLAMTADETFADVPEPDIIVVPGGIGSRDERNAAVVDWVRAAHSASKWTTSVCTGALILGAAGVLDGLAATTHWLFYDHLRALGAEPTGERVVQEGKVITAAGVSAGIDMGLRLAALEAGDEVAQAVQLMIEYDPQPPFDAGSPDKAPPAIVDLVTTLARQAGEV